VQVRGDESSLRTLFANLLDNALGYTPAQGSVSVSRQEQSGLPIVRVEDSGPGIPLADRQRVFDRFYRRPGIDQPGTGHPGTGLGLAIVHTIAERHGLKLTLGTAAAGGLLVTIEFPSSDTAAAPA
jgi:two-component system OmpR family sensor kinase